jgi:hypothetical protein
MILPLLVACSNLSDPAFFGGGTRTATGELAGADTGSTDDTGSDTGNGGGGGGDEDAPEITDGSAFFETLESAEADFLKVVLSYTDTQDDVVGGKVFFDVIEDGGAPQTESMTLVSAEDLSDLTSQAAVADGNVSFVWGPVDTSNDYIVDAIIVKDAAGHESNAWALEVAAE